MKPQIAALVLVHEQPEYLAVTLQALANQTRKPDSVLIVDTSANSVCDQVAQGFADFDYLKIESDSSMKSSIEIALGHFEIAPTWLWLLHDDSAPEKSALAELLIAAERSPSVALVGPKQLDWQNPRQILQLGLTLAPNGDIFVPQAGELDQAQHDENDDVLAIGTAGALIKTEAYLALDGLSKSAPALAADLDLSIRARLAGFRVLVAPRAKVVHAGLSLAGQRPKRWLKASPKTAIRRAEIHLRMNYLSGFAAFVFWFFLPLIGLGRSLAAIANKRPQAIFSEISASLWGWFTVFARTSSRRKIKRIRKFSFAKLKPLRATWAQVKEARLARFDENYFENPNAADGNAQSELMASAEIDRSDKGFIGGGAIWLTMALLIANFSFWPKGIAASGAGVLPLSGNWIDLFNRAGASYQNIGIGYLAPSDPFVWVLTTLGSLTFWAPSLAIAAGLFAFKALAFVAAWRLVADLTKSAIARNLAALAYAVYPFALIYQTEARLPVLVAYLLLPIFCWSAIRVAGLTAKSRFANAQQRVTWLATAALSMAAIAASVPLAGLVALALLAALVLVRIKRIGYLLWIPLPTAAIYGPTVLFYFLNLKQPLGLLAEPGLPQPNSEMAIVKLGFLEPLGLSAITPNHLSLVIFSLALIALLLRRTGLAAALAIASIVLQTATTVVDQVQISAVGVGSTSIVAQSVALGSGGFAIAVALISSLLIALTIDGLAGASRKRKVLRPVVASVMTLVLVAPALTFSWANPSQLKYSDGRTVPSIVSAEVQAGSDLKLLSIRPSLEPDSKAVYAAELVNGDGVQLEDVSLSYRFAVSKIASDSAIYAQVSQLVADLASGSTGQIQSKLDELGLGYVLISNSDLPQASDLAFSLDSIGELEAVGETEFGQLWRVREPNQALLHKNGTDQPDWSITKAVQLSILLGFALMALPSRNRGRQRAQESDIFVDANEDSND